MSIVLIVKIVMDVPWNPQHRSCIYESFWTRDSPALFTNLSRNKNREFIQLPLFWLSSIINLIADWNNSLNIRGVYFKILKTTPHRILIYVYRKNRLLQDLSCPKVISFLAEIGYIKLEILIRVWIFYHCGFKFHGLSPWNWIISELSIWGCWRIYQPSGERLYPLRILEGLL